MSRLARFLKYWVPALLWMGLIFTASSDAGSTEHSSRILGPLLRWLWPGASAETIEGWVTGIRKAAHVTEYAVLAWLLWRAFRQPGRSDSRAWDWKLAGWAWVATLAYAVTDEFHQTFVPSRQGQVTDVLLDALGALAGLLAVWLVGRWRNRW